MLVCLHINMSNGKYLCRKPALRHSHFLSIHQTCHLLPPRVSSGLGVVNTQLPPLQHRNQMSDAMNLLKDTSLTMDRDKCSHSRVRSQVVKILTISSEWPLAVLVETTERLDLRTSVSVYIYQ